MMNTHEAPDPTDEQISQAMRAVAEQFKEKFEPNESEESDLNIISRMEEEGWMFKKIATDAHGVKAEEASDKKIKIIGRGTKFLIFERPVDNIHGNYDYE